MYVMRVRICVSFIMSVALPLPGIEPGIGGQEEGESGEVGTRILKRLKRTRRCRSVGVSIREPLCAIPLPPPAFFAAQTGPKQTKERVPTDIPNPSISNNERVTPIFRCFGVPQNPSIPAAKPCVECAPPTNRASISASFPIQCYSRLSFPE